MTRWMCAKCHYEFEQDTRPEVCPKCNWFPNWHKDELSQCPKCLCMTKTMDDRTCGKCKQQKVPDGYHEYWKPKNPERCKAEHPRWRIQCRLKEWHTGKHKHWSSLRKEKPMEW